MVDIIIIGAGPGGYELALEASKNGLEVVLIEKDELGGTCLNSGCIPTKAYYGSAKAIKEINKFPEIKANINFNMEELKARKDKLIEELRNGIAFLLNKANVKVIKGTAKIVEKDKVEVNGDVIQTKNIVIATGSSARKINNINVNYKNIVDAKELLELTTIPEKLVIVGGGVIGIEMATIFKTFGSDVTIIEMAPTILPNFDKEVIRRFQTYLKSNGIKVILNARIQEIQEKKVTFNIGDVANETEYGKLLLAIGRKANLSDIWGEKLDINVNTINDSIISVIVDENFQTNIPGIYAIGDVVGKNLLAHYATYGGYRVLNHILGRTDNINFDLIPACVFTFPELASVGLTEEMCIANNIEYKTLKNMYRTNGKANATLAADGFIKIIIQDDKIIGAHIIGADANTLIHELMVLINCNASVNDIKDYIHAHPTLSEVISGLFHI